MSWLLSRENHRVMGLCHATRFELGVGKIKGRGKWGQKYAMENYIAELMLHEDGTLTGTHTAGNARRSKVKGQWYKSGALEYTDLTDYDFWGQLSFELEPRRVNVLEGTFTASKSNRKHDFGVVTLKLTKEGTDPRVITKV